MDYKQIIDNEKSKGYFNMSHADEMVSYLLQEQCPEMILKNFCSGIQGFAVENSFVFDDVELGIDYFLGNSENAVYDIIGYNTNYNKQNDYIVLGVLQGGDTFGFLKGKNEIYLNLDTGTNFDDDIFVCISKNITDFLSCAFKDNSCK